MFGGIPAPYDASALRGFAFDISGATVPAGAALRFRAADGSQEFCTPARKRIVLGTNTVLFTELTTECGGSSTCAIAATSQAKLLRISWQVVTNSVGTTPFDFCVSNVVAIPK